MPTLIKKWLPVMLLCMLAASGPARAQDDTASAGKTDSIVPEEIVNLKYFSANNKMQYLILEHQLKTGKKYEPLKNKEFRVYMDSIDAALLVGKLTTSEAGLAKAFIPPGLKTAWDATGMHKFIAVAAGKEEAAVEISVTRAKLEIDTVNEDGARSITVTLLKLDGGEWTPAPDVEMQAGVQRLGGILPGGEEATYTTDSSGKATIAFTRGSMPGDAKGNIVLAARVDGHYELGTLLLEQPVPWGKPTVTGNNFFSQRTLWSTRFKTPLWLLFMAYTIVTAVWGTLIYLILQLVKIKKLGRQAEVAG